MSDYTPTTEDVRMAYQVCNGPNDGHYFDDWLAEHDRQVQAEALRKFRQEVIDDQVETYGIVLPDVDGIIDRLDEAADEIEKGQTDEH